MREIRQSGSAGGETQINEPSLPLSYFSIDPKASSAFSLWHKICGPVEHLNSVSATCVIEIL